MKKFVQLIMTKTHNDFLDRNITAFPSLSLSPFLQRHFCVLAMSFPGQEALYSIYSNILQQHLLHSGEFAPDVKKPHVLKELVETSLLFHHRMTSSFLPTAIKFHYNFNLRDLSNIYQVIFPTNEVKP